MPVAVFSDAAEVLEYARASPYAQQAAIFTQSAAAAAPLIDGLANAVGRINLNAQCARGPDELPFTGRRSSALGTMSVSEALRAFSIETLVTAKAAGSVEQLAHDLPARSAFMQALGGPPARTGGHEGGEHARDEL